MLVQVRRVLLAFAALVVMAPGMALAQHHHHGPGPRPPTPPVQPPAAVQQQIIQQQMQRSSPVASSASRVAVVPGYPAQSALADKVNSWRDFGTLSDAELIALFREMGLDLASGSGLSGAELVGAIKRQALAEGATREQIAAIDAMLQTSGPALAATVDRLQDSAPSALAQAFRDEYAKTCMCDTAAFATALGKAETRVVQNGEAALLVSLGMPSDVAASMATTTVEYGRNDDEMRYAAFVIGSNSSSEIAAAPIVTDTGTGSGGSGFGNDTDTGPPSIDPVAALVPPADGGGGGGGGDGAGVAPPMPPDGGIGVPDTPGPIVVEIPGPVDLGPGPIGELGTIIPDKSVEPSPVTREALDPAPSDPPAETVVADLTGKGTDGGDAGPPSVVYDIDNLPPDCPSGDYQCRRARDKVLDELLDQKLAEMKEQVDRFSKLVDEGERNVVEMRHRLVEAESIPIRAENEMWNSWWMSGFIDYGSTIIGGIKTGVVVGACMLGPAVCGSVVAIDSVATKIEYGAGFAGEFSAEMNYGSGDIGKAYDAAATATSKQIVADKLGSMVGGIAGKKFKDSVRTGELDKIADRAVENYAKFAPQVGKRKAERLAANIYYGASDTLRGQNIEAISAVAGFVAKGVDAKVGATNAVVDFSVANKAKLGTGIAGSGVRP